MVLFYIGVIVLFLGALILPWVNRSRILRLRDEVERLNDRLARLENVAERKKTSVPVSTAEPVAVPKPVYKDLPSAIDIKEKVIQENFFREEKKEPPKKNKAEKNQGFERQFGARLPVWIGGVALALAGFYFVKYSIDAGWLSPLVRVTLGMLAGVAMLFAGNAIRNKPDFADGTRIAQALSGAGIADLYVCIFAATNLYNLVPSLTGFIGMAVVTAVAVILSLRHGAPIALLGLIGGFLTPALIGSAHPSAPALFIYLYFILTGLMVVVRKKGWWLLAALAVAASFLWVLVWLFGGSFSAGDTLWLGLFLGAVSFTTIKLAHSDRHAESSSLDISWTDALMGGALLLMGLVSAKGGFGDLEWSLFGLLAAGGIVMAFFDQAQYGKVPLFSAAINAVMLAYWHFQDPQDFALILSIFSALYIFCGYKLQSRSKNPLQWSLLISSVAMGYYLLGYFRLHERMPLDIPHFWGLLALVMSALSVKVLAQIVRDVPDSHAQKQHLLAVFAGTATAFLSIGLCIELDREFLSVAFAAEALALAWINARVNILAMRKIITAVAAVFGFLLTPQILMLAQLTVYSLVEQKMYFQEGVPVVNWPVFQLGIPAIFFLTASLLLRRQKDDFLVRAFEVASITLTGVMGYYMTRHFVHPGENILFIQAGFFERGLITNIIFGYGLICLIAGDKYGRNAVSMSGVVLGAIAAFRLGYFDFFAHNPLWSRQDVGAAPVFNYLLLTYGAPVFWIHRMIGCLPPRFVEAGQKYGYGLMLLLSFALLSFEVRQVFHGAFLSIGQPANAEIYAYSVVWLLFGVGLLFFGTLRKDKMIRVASLGVMILTVGKVFLYDASALEGLFKVFSFAGLGLSLLGLSWFYTRFVFHGKEED